MRRLIALVLVGVISLGLSLVLVAQHRVCLRLD
jgi:hypothetical protein